MNADPLEWLLPEAGARERAELRRVVQALRALRADLTRPGTRSVEPSWFRARGELEDLARLEALRALESVLTAHLAALRPADSFLPLPPTRLALDEAWRRLLARRLCAPAHPRESLVSAAHGLVARGVALGTPGFWAEYWRAALAHVDAGPRTRRWERELSAVRTARVRPRVLARFVGGLAASELERGAPARALGLLRAHAPLWRLDASLARLAHWSALVLGEAGDGDPLPGDPLPLALAELAGSDPRWAAELARGALAGEARLLREVPARSELGASAWALWRLARGESAQLLSCEGSGVLRARVEHLRRRPPSALAAQRGEDGPLVARLPPGRAVSVLEGSLGGAGARALAFVFWRAEGARFCWQLEWPHALVPCRARLASLATLGARALVALAPVVRAAQDDARVRALAGLRQGLAALGVTRFVCFAPGVPAPWLCGTGLERWHARLARASAAEALPEGLRACELCAGNRLLARLFFAADERVAACVPATLALVTEALCAASFQAAERGRGRPEPWWDPLAPTLAPLARLELVGPWCLVGPRGSGRRTLARALLFRAGLEADEPSRIVTGCAPTRLAPGTVWIGEHEGAAPSGTLLRVPPLSARRDELASILRHLTRPGARVPFVLDDDGLAQLWRQEWGAGWRGLVALLERLSQSSGPIGAGEVRAALLETGVEPCASRPELGERECVALLAATRHRNGSPNLARAARWLGWRAGTLARRLQSFSQPE